TPIPSLLFFLNHTPPTVLYTLSLHDALPIWEIAWKGSRGLYAGFQPYRPLFYDLNGVFAPRLKNIGAEVQAGIGWESLRFYQPLDRKSTRLNSSHVSISYAVFCLKKKNMY